MSDLLIRQFGPQILPSNFQKNPLVSSRVCTDQWPECKLLRTARRLQNDDGLDGPGHFLLWQKRHEIESVRTKALVVWRPGIQMILSGDPKLSSRSSPSSILLESHDLKSAHTQVFDIFLCLHAASRSASARVRPHVHIYILIRYHGCYYRNDSAEKTFEKNTFLVNFGHPDFPTFCESVLFRVMCSHCNPQTNVGKQLLRNF